jgi:hypothetical protein
MAINFSNRVMVTNPNFHFLGKLVLAGGLAMAATGVYTFYTDDFVIPAKAWLAVSVPTLVIGAILYQRAWTRA